MAVALSQVRSIEFSFPNSIKAVSCGLRRECSPGPIRPALASGPTWPLRKPHVGKALSNLVACRNPVDVAHQAQDAERPDQQSETD